jgi:ferredoxin--NADP+ reductase
MAISIAIIGAGPAGFYTAEALLDLIPDARIDIIERLPTPFGLIRAGVAPDHQTTKKVARRFQQTALRELIQYYGNVEVGRDVTIDELRDMYDAVILAVGAPADRSLGIPGEDKTGVHGSTGFVGWYNGHPDYRGLAPGLDTETAVVVGNGNVALDIARVLVKSRPEMAISDLPDHAADAIHASPISDVYVLGRRGPAEAKFTNVELREMGRLEQCAPLVEPPLLEPSSETLSDRDRRLSEKNLATFREFIDAADATKPKRVHFRFFTAPVEILGEDRVEGIRVEKTRLENGRTVATGETSVIPCGLVVVAIGYRGLPFDGIPFDTARGLIPNDDGRIAEGLYAVGWAKRGPTGIIASNRPDGVNCAEQILEDIPKGAKPGREWLRRTLSKRRVRAVSFDDWLEIDAAETGSAIGPAPRRKFTTFAEMLAVIDQNRRRKLANRG